jgi:hypothetical protein
MRKTGDVGDICGAGKGTSAGTSDGGARYRVSDGKSRRVCKGLCSSSFFVSGEAMQSLRFQGYCYVGEGGMKLVRGEVYTQ